MGTELIIAVVLVPIVIIWMLALGDLMARRDDEFPGKSDKLAWAIVLTFTGILGAIVYTVCRPRKELASDPTAGQATADEQFQCMQCGATIPAGAAKCSACGWTYSQS